MDYDQGDYDVLEQGIPTYELLILNRVFLSFQTGLRFKHELRFILVSQLVILILIIVNIVL